MYERFTDRARRVMHFAQQAAQSFNHEYIETEHILIGLTQENGVAACVLRLLDIDLVKLRMEVEQILHRGPDMLSTGKLPMTPRAKRVMEYAIADAIALNHNYVGTEHLLLGLLREEEAIAAQVLKMHYGLTVEKVRQEIRTLLATTKAPPESVGLSQKAAAAINSPEGKAFLEARHAWVTTFLSEHAKDFFSLEWPADSPLTDEQKKVIERQLEEIVPKVLNDAVGKATLESIIGQTKTGNWMALPNQPGVRGPVHTVMEGRYCAVIRDGVPMIERADTTSRKAT